MKLRAARAIALAFALLAAPLPAGAQPAGTMRHIGYLSPGLGYPFEAFREGLIELGYVEGRNIAIERRSAEGQPERLQDLAADLVQLRVDVIVTATTAATQAAQRATTTIPIVFALADEPVELGLVASIAKPGGNITGLTGLRAKLTAKRLELLKEVSPRMTRVAVLWGPYPFSAAVLKEVESASRTLGLTLHEIEVREAIELDSAFTRMTAWRAEALLVLPHPMFVARRVHLAELAAKHRPRLERFLQNLPVIGWGNSTFIDIASETSLRSYARSGSASISEAMTADSVTRCASQGTATRARSV